MSLTDDLTQIKAAIAAIETGAQEYSIGSRRFKRPDLSLLYSERQSIQNRIQADDPGTGLFGRTYVSEFDGR